MNARAWQKQQQNSHLEALKKQDRRAQDALARANSEHEISYRRYEFTIRAAEIAAHEKAVRDAIVASLPPSTNSQILVKALLDATYQRPDMPERNFCEEYGVAPLPPARDYWESTLEEIKATREMERAGRAVIKATQLLEQQKALLHTIGATFQKFASWFGITSLFAVPELKKPYSPLQQITQASPNSPNTSV